MTIGELVDFVAGVKRDSLVYLEGRGRNHMTLLQDVQIETEMDSGKIIVILTDFEETNEKASTS